MKYPAASFATAPVKSVVVRTMSRGTRMVPDSVLDVATSITTPDNILAFAQDTEILGYREHHPRVLRERGETLYDPLLMTVTITFRH